NGTQVFRPSGNDVPYSGIGRLHVDGPFGTGTKNDEWSYINYQYFRSAQEALRDPERATWRANPNQPYPPNSYVPFNAPYTYPDLNNMFLAVVKAGPITDDKGNVLVPPGAVLQRSFHRDWIFNQNTPLNVVDKQVNSTTPWWFIGSGKYRTLRPRPWDQ